MRKIFWIIGLGMAATSVLAQTHTEKITREFSFEKSSPDNALLIANMNGDVKVIGYEGTKIQVEIMRTISGKTQARLEEGKTAIQLGVIDDVDSLVLYIEGTCSTFSKGTRSKNRNNSNRWMPNWNYSWSDCGRNCDENFDYTMDFVVKVPAGINVMVSTINDGEIIVENVKGIVYASNINGGVKLKNLMREADASSINGDVDIEYAKNPIKDCRFYSLNGDINAYFQKGLAANFSFESFNGDFYTDIEPLESLPVRVEETKNGEGVKYKINGNRYKIRTGGPLLDFETFNGNVYVKERTN
jgi:DUF4097 and DUF4098 domain-containing protein YvlB